ncbi:hypothetical protein BH10ACI4_BH10ACI4_08760 [soil metagenome]
MDTQTRKIEYSETSADHQAKNILETLTNLIYLAKIDATSEENVKLYMNLAENCVKQLATTLYPRP